MGLSDRRKPPIQTARRHQSANVKVSPYPNLRLTSLTEWTYTVFGNLEDNLVRRDSTSGDMAFTMTVPTRAASSRANLARQRRAVGKTVEVFQKLLNRFAPDQLEVIADHIQQALVEPSPESPRAGFVREFAEARDYGAEGRAALRLETVLRSFQRRDELLRDSLTASEVAAILSTTRQTPHDRVASGSLLAVLDRGALRFPPWQFDPNGPDRVADGLPTVIRALRMSPIAKINWFVRPNPYLDGRRPIDALKQGEVERVLDAARGTGPG